MKSHPISLRFGRIPSKTARRRIDQISIPSLTNSGSNGRFSRPIRQDRTLAQRFQQACKGRNRDKNKDNGNRRRSASAVNATGMRNAHISMLQWPQTVGRRTLRYASGSTSSSRNLRRRPKSTKQSKTAKNGKPNNKKKIPRFSIKVSLSRFSRHSVKTKNFRFGVVSFSIREPTSMSATMSTGQLGQSGQPVLANASRQAADGFRSSDMAKSRSKPLRPHHGTNRR